MQPGTLDDPRAEIERAIAMTRNRREKEPLTQKPASLGKHKN